MLDRSGSCVRVGVSSSGDLCSEMCFAFGSGAVTFDVFVVMLRQGCDANRVIVIVLREVPDQVAFVVVFVVIFARMFLTLSLFIAW